MYSAIDGQEFGWEVVVVTDDDALVEAVRSVAPASRLRSGERPVLGDGSSRCILYDLADGSIEAFRGLADAAPGTTLIACLPPEQPDLAGVALDAGASDVLRRDLLIERPALLDRRYSSASHRESQARRERPADAVYWLDSDGHVRDANERAVEMTGYERSALLDLSIRDVTVGLDDGSLPDRLRELAVGETTTYEAAHSRRDGGTVPVEVRAKRVDDGFVLSAREREQPGRATAELEASERSLRLLHRATADAGLGFDEKLDRLLSIGCERLGLRTGLLSRIDDDQRRIVAHVDEADEWLEPSERCRRLTLQQTEAVCLHDEQSSEDGDEPAIGAYIGCTVTVGGEQFGTLCFQSDAARDPFTEYERTMVELLAQWIGYELERRENDRKLAIRDAAIDAAADAIYQLDQQGRFTMVNDALVEMTGYERSELLGEYVSVVITDQDAARGQQVISEALATDDSRPIKLPLTIEPKTGAPFPAESRITVITDETGAFQGTIGVSRDVSRQRAFEATLTELHDVSRELLTASTQLEIAETVVEASTALTDSAVTGVYLFNQQTNALEPMAMNDYAHEMIDDPPTFGAGEGIAWDVFVDGERRRYDDVRDSDAVYNPDTAIRSELLVPLGDHGVLLCGSTTVEQFDEQTAELADILAANAEAALDRMDREQRIRKREQELRAQNRRLRQLDSVNDRVRRIAHDLVRAESREEIERTVCERLAGVDDYEFVWLGAAEPTSRAITPRATGGTGRGYLDSVGATSEERSDEPTEQARQRRETVVVEYIAEQLRDGEWQQQALSRNFMAAISVPLVYNGVPYGVLSVYPNSTEALTDETIAVLEELGETVAHAISVVEQRQARLSDRRVELEFLLDDANTVLPSLSRQLDGVLTVDRVVTQGEDTTLLYGTVDGVGAASVTDAADALHGIDHCRILGTEDEQVRFELTVSGPSLARPIADHGGTFERLVLEDGRTHVVASFPGSAPINEIIDMYVGRFPSAELLARRDRERDLDDDSTPLSMLTERQRQTIDVAYHSGFFEWPRESTGEDIAATLDITAPTFLEHLRRAEATLISELLESE